MVSREVTALADSSSSTSTAKEVRERAVVRRSKRLVHIAFGFSGAAALIYEVVWTRQLQLVFGSTVYAVSLMLGAFMAGLSLGSFLGGRRVDSHPNPVALFGQLEIGIGVFGLLSIPLIQLTPIIYFWFYNNLQASFPLYVLAQLILSFLVMLVPTTLMGATFPVVSKIIASSLEELGEDVGGVYSVNTLGSIAGSLGAGFMLIPLVGVRATTITAALVNLVVGVCMVMLGTRRRPGRIHISLLVVFAAVLVASLATPQSAAMLTMDLYRVPEESSLADFLRNKADTRTLYFRDAAEGPVAVLQLPNGALQLRNSGATEGATVFADFQTMELAADLPLSVSKRPERVLVIGLGTGATSVDVLGDDRVEELTTAEINPAVVEASEYFVGDALTSDSRSTIAVADARNYLLATEERFDVITSEPSYPLSTHVTQLFTREFFEVVRDTLADDGVVCQWFPAYLLEERDQQVVLKTFRSVFPETLVFVTRAADGRLGDIFAVAGTNETSLLSSSTVEAVQARSEESFSFELWMDSDQLADWTASDEIPLNTDDRPYLEFRTPYNHIRSLWLDR